MKGAKTMSMDVLEIVLKGAADQVKITASALKFLQDILPPEQVAKIPFDLDKEIAAGFELADRARQMAEEMKK
ncbi:MAG: hypothetical protein FWH27_15670 [Planctomycetaceae bacterium]|nr:hypothetical protein [Planctomycetaceae bacterium]